jgi:hypothetical protein
MNRFLLKFLLLAFILPALLAAQIKLSKPILSGTITCPELSEISGLAVSHRNPDILWCINDSGNPATLYAVTTKGEFRRKYPVNAPNQDWEDLSSFVWEGKPYLLIADVGDNDEKRNLYQIYIVEEPDLNNTSETLRTIPLVQTITFRYEDGLKDCESAAVDVSNRQILLVSKQTKIPQVYSFPLDFEPHASIQITKKMAALTKAPLPTDEQKTRNPLYQYAGQPTAMDVSESGELAVVLTYINCWIFVKDKMDWTEAFQQTPVSVYLPLLRQAESICFDQTGRTIYVTTEKLPAPIYQIQIE